jgi:hypothetical protein
MVSKGKKDFESDDIKKLLLSEFQLLGNEIKGLEEQISSYFVKIVSEHTKALSYS